MVLDAVLYYFEYYFLTLYLPFFCQCLILFMPLVASGVCFLAGHLIGYVLAGYFASGAIFISALASYYIMFFYPRYRQEFLNNFRNESTET